MALKDSLIGVWCESASPATDQHSNGLTLTDNNTVATAAGKIGRTGFFQTANLESLSRADEALLSTGDVSYTEAAWVLLSVTHGDNQYISSKATGGGGGVMERGLLYRTTLGENRFRAYIADFAVGVAANELGIPIAGIWYYVQAQHDAANNKLRIRLNDGAWDEVATAGVAPTDSAAPFYIGAYNDAGTPILQFDGYINQYAFWKRALSDAELNRLYNAGNGLAFSNWDGFSGQFTVGEWVYYAP